MRLSISSSNDRLPTGSWLAVWTVVAILSLALILFFEFKIRHQGWKPSVVDSKQLWAYHRKRASELGDKAIILVGSSRIQLDTDLTVVKKFSKLEPIQLAIDGTPWMPVLENLAQDNSIRGTIIVSVNGSTVNLGSSSSKASQWVEYYKNIYSESNEPYRVVNNKIKSFIEDHMITRFEGARPITVISKLAFAEPSLGNYLITHHDRSRDADYQKVHMPYFYLTRLQRHFGRKIIDKKVSLNEFSSIYKNAIMNLKPKENKNFLIGLNALMEIIHTIESRGGKVFLVRFPTDKLLWEIDNKRYPKNLFWKQIEKRHPRSIHFSNYQSLSKYHLPDGSHLDYRDKEPFTRSLMEIILGIK